MALDQGGRPEGDSGSVGGAAPRPPGGGMLLGAALGAGLVAGLAAWGASEATHRAFRPETRRVVTMAGPLEVAVPESKRRTDVANSAAVYGGLGALLGLAMGAAGGMLRGSTGVAARSAAIGAAVGAAAPSVLAAVVVPRHLDYLGGLDPRDVNLVMPMLFHGAVWIGVGVAGGLALGLSRGGRRGAINGVVGGLIGAVLGAGAYELISAMAMPRANSAVPLSEDRLVRLVACLSVALGVALLSAATLSSGDRPRPSKAGGPTSG
ncbi:hypothetical protein [Tautonia plasticadhaerens]|uniref:Uncharacterized protein n=1 Tax=Tautonia plasticadhaerens TaxID=2527974 RepID=A0A518GWE7_9BACT|nr:hypothetical protein [Tautonia plasticadhaerens]QDV32920.1 hypothetical protein ElP_07620 [Tautonia plasticadhaerens]